MTDPTPTAGHNNPPPYDPTEVERLNAEAAQFLDAAGEWIEAGPITSEDQAAKLNDFISGNSAKEKLVEEARKAAKKPHDDAGKAVQAAYVPIIDKIKRATTKVRPLLAAWLKKKQDERDAEVARLAKEAEFKRKEAEEKAAAALARNDISGEIDAEAAKKEAEDLAKNAERMANTTAKVSSASGGGRTASLRNVAIVEVTNLNVLFMRYKDAQEVHDCLLTLAKAEVRAKDFNPKTDKIPGCNIRIEQR